MRINAIKAYNNPYSGTGKSCAPRKSNNFMPAQDNISFGFVAPSAAKTVKNILNDPKLYKTLDNCRLIFIEMDEGKLYGEIYYDYMKNSKAGKKVVKSIRKMHGLKKNWCDDLNDSLQNYKVRVLAKLADQFKKKGIAATTNNVKYRSRIPKPDYSWDWRSSL